MTSLWNNGTVKGQNASIAVYLHDPWPGILCCVLGQDTLLSHRVCTGLGKPGKSWNFIVAFSRTGKSWKRATGPGKFWKSL